MGRKSLSSACAVPIEHNSPGPVVHEPFSGSGTTIIAAGRSCHAIELDPGYVYVAVTRWPAFTGYATTLEGDGHTFDSIESGRSLLEVPA